MLKNLSGAYLSCLSFPRMSFRKGTTLKRFKWKSLDFLVDSRRLPDLHRFWVPQLTSATCGREHSLVPRQQRLCCWKRAAVHLYRAMIVVLVHSSSWVTCMVTCISTSEPTETPLWKKLLLLSLSINGITYLCTLYDLSMATDRRCRGSYPSQGFWDQSLWCPLPPERSGCIPPAAR